MRRLLFATVATAALMLAAPMAAAQYGTNAQPETTQVQTAPYNQPDMPPPTDATAAPDQTPAYGDPAAPTPPAATAYDGTAPADAYGAASAQTGTQTADAYGPGADAMTAGDGAPYGQAATATGATPYGQTQPATGATPYAQSASMGPDQSSSASMLQHAVDAGMSGVPMTAAEVCAPREVDLGASSRLSRDNMNKLENAADRASVCATQRVLVRAPGGRADAIRATLVEHGIDEARIDVEEGDAAAVEMHFAGVATSSQYYAQLYNGAQYASADPSLTQPGAMTGSSYMSQPGAASQPSPGIAQPAYDDTIEGGADYTPDPETDEGASEGMYEPTANEANNPDRGRYDL